MRIVVVGDVLLDRDVDGPSTRLCPDAPVPVVDVETSVHRAGGAGLVARMLAADGHDTTLVTVLSDDGAAGTLRGCLSGVRLVSGPSGAPTPVKTRVRQAGAPVVRFDEGCAPAPVPQARPDMLAALDTADAVVVADYGRGLLFNEDIRGALEVASARIPVVWDPHPRGAPPVPGTSVATPNLSEALAAAGETPAQDRAEGSAGPGPRTPEARPPEARTAEARRAAAALRQRWRVSAVVVTLGADGAWVDDGGAGRLLPAPAIGDPDPCGAGDRFAAGLAAALGTGPGAALATGPADAGQPVAPRPPLDLDRAVGAAVEAAARFLAGGGVGALPAPRSEVHEVPAGHPHAQALDAVRRIRAAGGTVVATGGCFDLVHIGHLRTLRAARAMGDALVVCLNSDDSVRRLKGPSRPIVAEEDRAELLAALDCVDAVVVFDEDTPLEILSVLRPDVWVKGGDYIAERLPEHALLAGWGGRCVTVPFHPGRSTSSLAAALAAG